eukprot:scaffold24208_cov51-Prasinocladus_malaysianus.AAC.1
MVGYGRGIHGGKDLGRKLLDHSDVILGVALSTHIPQEAVHQAASTTMITPLWTYNPPLIGSQASLYLNISEAGTCNNTREPTCSLAALRWLRLKQYVV